MPDSGGTPATSVNNNPGQVTKQGSPSPARTGSVDAPMPATFNPPGYVRRNMGAPDVAHTGNPS